jgi:hypothetical protein
MYSIAKEVNSTVPRGKATNFRYCHQSASEDFHVNVKALSLRECVKALSNRSYTMNSFVQPLRMHCVTFQWEIEGAAPNNVVLSVVCSQ